jgi:hypothetical protein
VNNPADASVFLSKLLPRLEQMGQELPDPEARSVAAAAQETVIKICREAEEAEPPKK